MGCHTQTTNTIHSQRCKNVESHIVSVFFTFLLRKSSRIQEGFLDSWPLNMVPTGSPEMSVRNYHYSLPISTEERSSNLLRDGSLIPCLLTCKWKTTMSNLHRNYYNSTICVLNLSLSRLATLSGSPSKPNAMFYNIIYDTYKTLSSLTPIYIYVFCAYDKDDKFCLSLPTSTGLLVANKILLSTFKTSLLTHKK